VRIEKVFNNLWEYLISETEGIKSFAGDKAMGESRLFATFLIPSEGGLISADRLLLLVIFSHILYLLERLTPFDIPHNTF
jgi:hypothetical protein